jgi:hypothetical protein
MSDLKATLLAVRSFGIVCNMYDGTANQMERCPIANMCSITAGNTAPECGTVREHMAPLVVSEGMCIRALRGANGIIRDYESDWEQNQITKSYWLAGAELELGMAHPNDHMAERHFKEAAVLCDALLVNPRARIDTKTDAALMATYLPVYRSLRKKDTLAPRLRNNVRQGLGIVYDYIQSLPNCGTTPVATAEVENMRTHGIHRLAVMMAAEKGGYMFIPAKPREKLSDYPTRGAARMGPEEKRQKHDMYHILDASKGLKLPIRVNTNIKQGSGHGVTVLNIGFKQLVAQTMDGLRTRTATSENRSLYVAVMKLVGSREELIHQVPKWLVDELRGDPLTQAQRDLLTHFSFCLNQKISQRREAIGTDPLIVQGGYTLSPVVLEQLGSLGLTAKNDKE